MEIALSIPVFKAPTRSVARKSSRKEEGLAPKPVAWVPLLLSIKVISDVIDVFGIDVLSPKEEVAAVVDAAKAGAWAYRFYIDWLVSVVLDLRVLRDVSFAAYLADKRRVAR